jgi:hypothetical protein
MGDRSFYKGDNNLKLCALNVALSSLARRVENRKAQRRRIIQYTELSRLVADLTASIQSTAAWNVPLNGVLLAAISVTLR